MIRSEVLIALVIFVFLTAMMISIDAVELFYEFTRSHEEWELDEIIVASLALLVSVLVSSILVLRRHAKQLVLANEKVRNASESKSQMIITVSHELRTPLTSIRGAIGLLSVDKDKSLDERSRKLLDLAERNVLRLGTLIDDTVNIERITNNPDAFSYTLVPARTLLLHAYEDNLISNHKPGVTLIKEDDNSDYDVRVDENRIMQVFGNLITNAFKYTDEGGTVTIGCINKADKAVFYVKDTGSGIPADFKEHAFQRFSRADASESFHTGGAGLGLAISKAIIEVHGGRIWYESEIGNGSTFHFELNKI
jgi:signal transduction histidine kinase